MACEPHTRPVSILGSASHLLRLQLNREPNRELGRNLRGQIDKVHVKAYDKGNRPGTWDLRFALSGIWQLASGTRHLVPRLQLSQTYSSIKP